MRRYYIFEDDLYTGGRRHRDPIGLFSILARIAGYAVMFGIGYVIAQVLGGVFDALCLLF